MGKSYQDLVDNDPDAMLEHRMVQRIAIGFWKQANGHGFQRMRMRLERGPLCDARRGTVDEVHELIGRRSVRMTVCLTAPFAAPKSGVLTAIAIGEPDPKCARLDSNQ